MLDTSIENPPPDEFRSESPTSPSGIDAMRDLFAARSEKALADREIALLEHPATPEEMAGRQARLEKELDDEALKVLGLGAYRAVGLFILESDGWRGPQAAQIMLGRQFSGHLLAVTDRKLGIAQVKVIPGDLVDDLRSFLGFSKEDRQIMLRALLASSADRAGLEPKYHCKIISAGELWSPAK